MLGLFDCIFLLSLDHETQMHRLATSAGEHRSETVCAQILDGRPVFENEMCSAGAVVLDARQPTSVVVDQILQHTDRLRMRVQRTAGVALTCP
jgi:hypothetical protein